VGLVLILGLLTFVSAVVLEIWLRMDDRVRKLERSRSPWGGVVESWQEPSASQTSEFMLKLLTHVPDDPEQFTSGFDPEQKGRYFGIRRPSVVPSSKAATGTDPSR
jgi:hypothetical protein